MYRRNVGGIPVATVHDGMLSTAFDDIVGADPAVCEAAHRAALRDVPPTLSCNTFVLETPQALVLIDAGCGRTAPDAGHHAAGLEHLGIRPADVDLVLMTHLHRDHAAGLLDPAGERRLSEGRARGSSGRTRLLARRPKLGAAAGQPEMGLLDRPGRFVGLCGSRATDRLPGTSCPASLRCPHLVIHPGTRPGFSSWAAIACSFWGDVVHLPAIQFAMPEASVVYDLDSKAAAVARRRVLDMVAAEQLPVAGVHLDFPCYGRVQATSGGASPTRPKSGLRFFRLRRSPSLQPPLGDPAHHRIGGIEDVADVVAHDLAEEMARRHRRQAVVGGQPVQHLGRGMLQRLIERAGVADGEDVGCRFPARPADRCGPFRPSDGPRPRRSSRCRCRRSRRRPGPRGSRRAQNSAPGTATGNQTLVPGPNPR